MGQRDIELLATLANKNSPDLERVLERLRRKATAIATIFFPDSKQAQVAAEQALDKAIDWLNSDEPFHVRYPTSYVERLIHNAIIDLVRTQKEEPLLDAQIEADLTWIDEGIAAFDDEESGEPHGWRGYKVKGAAELEAPSGYPKHGWLRALCGLELQWYREAYQRHPNGVFVSSFSCDNRERDRLVKQKKREIKKLNLLLESIASLSEGTIMTRYLWGLKVTEIAKELGVSKPYVSRVVAKWMAFWKCDRVTCQQARIILLVYNVNKIDNESQRRIPEIKRQVERTLDLERYSSWGVNRLVVEEAQKQFYNLLKTRPETNSYFHDLTTDDLPQLHDLQHSCRTLFFLDYF